MTAVATKHLEIKNKLGLHARAATKLVELVANFDSEITLSNEQKSANAKSVMALLLLAGAQGKVIKVNCIGNDAEQALIAIEDLINNKFEEAE